MTASPAKGRAKAIGIVSSETVMEKNNHRRRKSSLPIRF